MNRLFPPFISGAGGVGLLLVRLTVGLAFMLHGWGKVQNPFGWMGPDAGTPAVMQALAAFGEFAGGGMLLLGLLTPLAGVWLAAVMLGALSITHLPARHPFVGSGGPSYELALVYLTVAVLFVLVGPGRYSVDSVLFGRGAADSVPINPGTLRRR